MRDLVIIGAGGFGRETIDVVRAINTYTPTWNLKGILDHSPSEENLERLQALNVPYLGTLSDFSEGDSAAIAIGNPYVRQRIASRLESCDTDFPCLIHPTTTLGSNFHAADGSILLGGVSVGTNVILGKHVHLNSQVVIGHDTRIYDFVSVNPNATVSGECILLQNSLVGAAATVLQNLQIGPDTTVGAGSVVTRSTTLRTVKGVPAR